MLAVGLLFVAYLLVNKPTAATSVPGGTPISQAINPPVGSSQVPAAAPTANANTTPEPTIEAAPRMDIKDFKALYDDPAKRPLIVDVRAKAAYDQGHIRGAINIPEADLATRVNEFPKDKLVIAYCQ